MAKPMTNWREKYSVKEWADHMYRCGYPLEVIAATMEITVDELKAILRSEE